ncbi:MAG: MarR family transcriptional regulator, partial [Actinomycetota bacterium]|nr:MarR family transcriptional regulator [Actinomycetota bacterium]
MLQTLYGTGTLSRADLARATGLTRVTISDLVAELMADNLIVETGQAHDARPGKPAKMLDINRSGFQIIGIDLSEYAVFRGAVLDLDGVILERVEVLLDGAAGSGLTGTAVTAQVVA